MIFWGIVTYFSVGLICAGFLFWCIISLPFKTEHNPSLWKRLKFFNKDHDEDFWFCIGVVIGAFFLWPLAILSSWLVVMRYKK